MAKNPYNGKVFESDFQSSCISAGIKPIRLYDPVGQFKGVGNICDFIVYKYPAMVCFELKSTMGERFPFSNITETQYNGMLEQVDENDAVAGLLIHFTESVGSLTIFVPINIIRTFKLEGKASISVLEAIQFGVGLPSKLKRTRFNYFPTDKFFNDIRRCQATWQGRR